MNLSAHKLALSSWLIVITKIDELLFGILKKEED